MTGAAKFPFIHLVVRETLARPGKQRRVAGETEILIVLPVRKNTGLGRVGLAVFLHDGNAYLGRHGQHGRRSEHKRAEQSERERALADAQPTPDATAGSEAGTDAIVAALGLPMGNTSRPNCSFKTSAMAR